jgi:hypothetical protein
VAIEVVIGQHGPSASEFEQLARSIESQLCAEDLRLGHGNLRLGDCLWSGVSQGAIDGAARTLQ